ncbi:hypothetical protein B447_10273 [Thauera sp. 27]|nr:hypothetical protein B447_10273 [Thauera sp. 27]
MPTEAGGRMRERADQWCDIDRVDLPAQFQAALAGCDVQYWLVVELDIQYRPPMNEPEGGNLPSHGQPAYMTLRGVFGEYAPASPERSRALEQADVMSAMGSQCGIDERRRGLGDDEGKQEECR